MPGTGVNKTRLNSGGYGHCFSGGHGWTELSSPPLSVPARYLPVGPESGRVFSGPYYRSITHLPKAGGCPSAEVGGPSRPDYVGLDYLGLDPLVDRDEERFGRFKNLFNLMRSQGFKVNGYKKLGIMDRFW